MGNKIKKYFWVFDITTILVLMYFSASSVNQYLGLKFWTPPSAPAHKVVVKQADPQDQNIKKTKVFGEEPEKLEEEPLEEEIIEEQKEEVQQATEKPVLSNLPATLIAIISSNIKEQSVAVIQDKSTRQNDSYKVSDLLLKEAVITKIDRFRVYFKRNNQLEFLTLLDEEDEKLAQKLADPAPEGDGASTQEEPEGGVQKVNDGKYIIDQNVISDTLSNLSQVATQARIVPYFRDGKAVGFKLFAIRPNSIYSKIGLMNSDVIKKINGYLLDSPEKFLEVYSKLKNAKNITLEIERNGSNQTKKYNIQ